MRYIGQVEWRRVGGDPTFVFTDGDAIRFYDSEASFLRHFHTLGFSPEIHWPRRFACMCRRCPRVGEVFVCLTDQVI